MLHQQLGALSDASRQRHRLVPGGPDYEAAPAIEERLAEHVWELATKPQPPDPQAGLEDRDGRPEPEN